ncbi:hypothetical protein CASFOL_003494 [Castilleja foliolosa]|uniref:Uncharacterized protein n=1 Tax=Castilleja foliolosa TaxID=1961234 RepID=A0ABD3EHC3_9LAMI
MGSCISVHKDQESALKLQFSIEPKKEQVLIPSPVKEKTDSVNAGDASAKSRLSSAPFVDKGSKDESFFDSQPWLESDCEDDFLSVNGDFTPSRGNTPVHHNFSSGNLQASNARPAEGPIVSKPEPSLSTFPDKKKRLSELFKESLRDNNYIDNQNEAPAKVIPEPIVNQPKSTNGTPYISGANSMTSSEATPSVELRDEDGQLKSGQCCFPRLVLSRSFSERKKKMSPAQIVG